MAGATQAVRAKLREMGYELPVLPPLAANFVRAVEHGGLLYVSGAADRSVQGKLGREVSLEAGYAAARSAALMCLAAAEQALGSLDRIARVVSVRGFVNATPEFDRHARVMDGASDLLVSLLGQQGRHARTTVGVASLPGNVAVEVDMILAVA